jgi:hypothetical protein
MGVSFQVFDRSIRYGEQAMRYILKTFPVSSNLIRHHWPPVLPSIKNYA